MRNLAVPVLAALTVAVLAISVFTLSAKATLAGQDAAALHLVDETLRSIDAADTLGRQMILLSLVDPDLGVDAASSTGVTMASFDVALADTEAGLRALAEVRGSTFTAVDQRAFAHARAALLDAVEQAQAGQPAAGLRVLLAEVLPALDEARDQILDHQSWFVDRLEANTTTLRAIAALVGFIVAFVAPTVAILVYRVVTRPPRQLRRYRARLTAVEERLDDVLLGMEQVIDHLDRDRLRLFVQAERGSLLVHRDRVDLRQVLEVRAHERSLRVVWETTRSEVSTDASLLGHLVDVVLEEIPPNDAHIVVSEHRGRVVIALPLDEDQPSAPWADLISQGNSVGRRAVLQSVRPSVTLAVRLAEQLGIELAHQVTQGHSGVSDVHRLVLSMDAAPSPVRRPTSVTRS